MRPAVLHETAVRTTWHQGWQVFETTIGWCAVTATTDGVRGVRIGYPTAQELTATLTAIASGDLDPDLMVRVAEAIVAYAAGEPVDFTEVPVADLWSTPFQRAVIAELRAVPSGQSLSYAELARRAGSPRAARAVGQVMSHNPVPLVVPCHRVLGSKGRLGGFSAPTGVSLKQRLLAMEAAGAKPTQES
jgi:methylated-DNA-[protein]-cysteine S-methyltransferase